MLSLIIACHCCHLLLWSLVVVDTRCFIAVVVACHYCRLSLLSLTFDVTCPVVVTKDSLTFTAEKVSNNEGFPA
jgi:hypothetical protein